jgi:hypothetical protein
MLEFFTSFATSWYVYADIIYGSACVLYAIYEYYNSVSSTSIQNEFVYRTHVKTQCISVWIHFTSLISLNSINVRNPDPSCFLWGKNWIFKYRLSKLHISEV